MAAPNVLNFSLLTSTLSQINRLVPTAKGSHLRGMQYCLLRVLRSNFLRLGEQLKTADEVGLVYSPLIPLSQKIEENEDGEGSRGGDVSSNGTCFESDMSHLVVYQLLQAVLHSLSGKHHGKVVREWRPLLEV